MPGKLAFGPGRGVHVELGRLLIILAALSTWRVQVNGVSLEKAREEKIQGLIRLEGREAEKSRQSVIRLEGRETEKRIQGVLKLEGREADIEGVIGQGGREEHRSHTSVGQHKILQVLASHTASNMLESESKGQQQIHGGNDPHRQDPLPGGQAVKDDHQPYGSQNSNTLWDTEYSHRNATNRIRRLQMYIQTILQILLSKIQNNQTTRPEHRASSQPLVYKRMRRDITSRQLEQFSSPEEILEQLESRNAGRENVTSLGYHDVTSQPTTSAHPKRHSKSRAKSRGKSRRKRFHLGKKWRKMAERKIVRLVRGPWMLAVSENDTVYATKQVNDPHTVFISHPIDAQLVALKTNISRKFLTFDKKGHLGTTEGLNRRTHFIVSPTPDNHYTYLSKYRSRAYWYLGITDTGHLTAYPRSRRNKKQRKRKKEDKKRDGDKERRERRDVREVLEGHEEGQEKAAILDHVITPSTPTPSLSQYPHLVTQQAESSTIITTPASVPSTSTSTPKSKHRHSRHKDKTGRRKNSERKRRKGRHRCKSQRCTCIRNNAIAPWCQFQIMPLGGSEDHHWPWFYHQSALDISRTSTR